VWAAGHRLREPLPREQVGLGLVLSVVSSALNGGLAWLMFQSARENRSVALEGDARHLMTDVWTSAGVIVGVGLALVAGKLGRVSQAGARAIAQFGVQPTAAARVPNHIPMRRCFGQRRALVEKVLGVGNHCGAASGVVGAGSARAINLGYRVSSVQRVIE